MGTAALGTRWLEMLKVRKPPKINTATGVELNIRRIALDESSDLREPHEGEQRARVTRSRSCGSISMHMRWDHDHRRFRGTVMNRHISVPSRDTKRIIIVDIHQPNPIRTKPEIQVESGAITKTSTSDQPESFKHQTRHVTRSKSSDENALLEMINRQKRARVTRSRSCGSISMHMRGDHDHRRLRRTVMNRRISVPSRDTKRVIIVDIHQPNPILVPRATRFFLNVVTSSSGDRKNYEFFDWLMKTACVMRKKITH
ncbi:hypothetical protein OS493_014880 [Desmophyllum pertusum]|uniref:Uncharacterized protein n=1 Tax=Desmophyllum pertusum TaxID=174260 RepID=A0A9W9YF36_9CNID|nr:hypothetical protein OS493_014880 [Desmophyllum pertusum]